jgi:hypothetical protein
MDRILIILTLVLLISCNSKIENNKIDEKVVIYDTIKVTELMTYNIYMENHDKTDFENSDFYIQERLPEWFLKTTILNGIELENGYEFNNRMNPLYLEADFNGDGNIDIVIPIKQNKSHKVGFAIIHGQTNEIYIVGAGNKINNGLSDDMGYINIWKVNRQKTNEPGLDENGDIDKDGPLILEYPSIQVEKSEVGGGQIYWNGNEYIYFHQTC